MKGYCGKEHRGSSCFQGNVPAGLKETHRNLNISSALSEDTLPVNLFVCHMLFVL